jgi:hypothetical protein
MSRLLLLCRLSFAGCLIACLHVSPTYAHQPDDGPQILVLSPQEHDTVKAPFDLDVRFLPAPDAPIDTETLKVQVRKMWGNVDVTEHIRQFTSQGGIHITNAHFPKGHHTVMLQIADELGRLSSKTMTMDVQ